MDPSLTRSKAHQVFGDLYRKPRSPELQKKVDEVVSSESDIFVRIKKIEELDRQFRSSGSPELRGGDGRRSNMSGGGQESRASRKAGMPPREPGSFWIRIFGGDLAVWGRRNSTFDVGFLGMKIELSRGVFKLFTNLKEDQVVATIKTLRSIMKFGWERWEPKRYNTVVAAYQFFNEFVKVASLFGKIDEDSNWVNQTLKMQKFYAMLIRYPDYAETLNEDLPELASISKELQTMVPTVKRTMKYITSLENRNPSLTNAILAFYAYTTRKIFNWEDILKQLDITEPITHQYRAPESILGMINAKIKKLKQDKNSKKLEIREIEEIKKNYFKFDESGKLVTDFIDEIVEDVVRRIFHENMLNESLIKNHKTQPHRLLYCIVRDFESTIATLLEGGVTVQSAGSTEEVIIIKSGLFRPSLDEVDMVYRSIDAFNKKNNNFSYSFKTFRDDIAKKNNSGGEVVAFLQIVSKANKALRNVATNIKTILDNHSMAFNSERSGQLKDKIARSKEIPIETLEIGMRFLPHSDRILMVNNRLNGLTVNKAFRESLMNLFNYLYLFRDQEIVKMLASSAKVEQEIANIETELKRMGADDSTD